MLDVTAAVSHDWLALKEIVLFLAQPLAPEFGLGLYVAVGDGGWMFRSADGQMPHRHSVPDAAGRSSEVETEWTVAIFLAACSVTLKLDSSTVRLATESW